MIQRKSLLFISALKLIATLVFISCVRQEEITTEDEIKGETQFAGVAEITYKDFTMGKSGGQLVMAVLNDPKTLNDAVAGETSSTHITKRLYASLVERSQQNLQWKTLVSESWSFSEDHKTITHSIRKGLKWSDGTDLNARDFVFSYNQVLLREDVLSSLRDSLFVNHLPVTVQLINDYTFSITTDTVYAGLLSISKVHPYPRHIFGPLIGWAEADGYEYQYDLVDGEVVEIKADHIDYSRINSFWGSDTEVSSIVGNGPFTVSEYDRGRRIILKRNPYYFETDAEGNQLPYLDKLVILFERDQESQLARFQSGETDFYSLRGKDYAALIDRKEKSGFEIYNVGPDSSTQFIVMNQNPHGEDVRPEVLLWTSNKQFRTALAHLVDRQTLINSVAYGFAYPQYSFIPRSSPYYWEDIDDMACKFDPHLAGKLLDELGWIDNDGDGIREDEKGNRISLRLTTDSGNNTRKAIGELFAYEAGKVGVEINLLQESFNALSSKLLSGHDWDMILTELSGSVDPISGANVYRSRGNLHLIEPNQIEPRREWERSVDEAWERANNTIDEAERTREWQIIQKIWAEELPWIYTYNKALLYAYDSRLANIQPRPVEDMDEFGILRYIYWK
ncbi:MAG: ABC transporter substrate-binding protein [Spirochaetaceae bacterium]|nr:ABC transporter substrate-binding protein [Spirochaetaceae bacterium]